MKFGELIQQKVVIVFYCAYSIDFVSVQQQLEELNKLFPDYKYSHIEIQKNSELSHALRIKHTTWLIYNGGQMLWRESENISTEDIAEKLKDLNL